MNCLLKITEEMTMEFVMNKCEILTMKKNYGKNKTSCKRKWRRKTACIELVHFFRTSGGTPSVSAALLMPIKNGTVLKGCPSLPLLELGIVGCCIP